MINNMFDGFVEDKTKRLYVPIGMESVGKAYGFFDCRASKEKIEEEFARLRQIRQKYPKFAQSRETALQKAEDKLTRWLEIYRDDGPSGIDDEPAGFDEIY